MILILEKMPTTRLLKAYKGRYRGRGYDSDYYTHPTGEGEVWFNGQGWCDAKVVQAELNTREDIPNKNIKKHVRQQQKRK